MQGSSGGAIAPEVSPDGRWLAFARRIPDGTISWKGHTYGPRNALWVRDLETGRERLLMDPIEVDLTETFKFLRVLPGYAWTPDGRAIVVVARRPAALASTWRPEAPRSFRSPPR